MSDGFGKLPNRLVETGLLAHLPNAALRILLAILLAIRNKTGTCWPSHDTLQRWAGVNKNAIAPGVRVLEAHRMIATKAIQIGGRPRRLYELLPPATWPDVTRGCRVCGAEARVLRDEETGRIVGTTGAQHDSRSSGHMFSPADLLNMTPENRESCTGQRNGTGTVTPDPRDTTTPERRDSDMTPERRDSNQTIRREVRADEEGVQGEPFSLRFGEADEQSTERAKAALKEKSGNGHGRTRLDIVKDLLRAGVSEDDVRRLGGGDLLCTARAELEAAQ